MVYEKRRILFVGGIPALLSEQSIFDYFSTFGQVIKVRIMKEKKTKEPKGYAYVTMADYRIVDKILDLSHVIENRKVDCQLASRKGEKKIWKDEQKKRRVFVTNLPSDVDGDRLQQLFASFGPIRNSYVISDYETRESKGYGYVEFLDPQDVTKVLIAFQSNLEDPTQIHCLPYLGRHEQKSQGWSQIPDSALDGKQSDLDTRSTELLEPSASCKPKNNDSTCEMANKSQVVDSGKTDQLCATSLLTKTKVLSARHATPELGSDDANLRFNIGSTAGWMNKLVNESFSKRDHVAKKATNFIQFTRLAKNSSKNFGKLYRQF